MFSMVSPMLTASPLLVMVSVIAFAMPVPLELVVCDDVVLDPEFEPEVFDEVLDDPEVSEFPFAYVVVLLARELIE